MSSSVILTDQLTTESAELKQAITVFMEEKTNEFKQLMKTNIENFVDSKLHSFYSRSYGNLEEVLFDTSCEAVIKAHIAKIESYMAHWDITGRKNANEKIRELERLKTKKCFAVSKQSYVGNGNETRIYYFFKTHILTESRSPNSDTYYDSYPHKFTTDVLFTIKHFQLGSGSQGGKRIDEMITIYDKHPEYFKAKCAEFETICQKEYDFIEIQKQNMQKMIDEQIKNKDYYAELEKKIKYVDKDQLKLEEERRKLVEEKRQLLLVKQKLSIMKKEVETEKAKLLSEKAKREVDDMNLDDYFIEVMAEFDEVMQN
jgi:hypothetical protein